MVYEYYSNKGFVLTQDLWLELLWGMILLKFILQISGSTFSQDSNFAFPLWTKAFYNSKFWMRQRLRPCKFLIDSYGEEHQMTMPFNALSELPFFAIKEGLQRVKWVGHRDFPFYLSKHNLTCDFSISF